MVNIGNTLVSSHHTTHWSCTTGCSSEGTSCLDRGTAAWWPSALHMELLQQTFIYYSWFISCLFIPYCPFVFFPLYCCSCPCPCFSSLLDIWLNWVLSKKNLGCRWRNEKDALVWGFFFFFRSTSRMRLFKVCFRLDINMFPIQPGMFCVECATCFPPFAHTSSVSVSNMHFLFVFSFIKRSIKKLCQLNSVFLLQNLTHLLHNGKFQIVPCL